MAPLLFRSVCMLMTVNQPTEGRDALAPVVAGLPAVTHIRQWVEGEAEAEA